MFIVYKLTSPSGKSYVGYSKNTVAVRWSGHVSNWKTWIRRGRPRADACTKLFYAFDKYPPQSWSHDVLYEGADKDVTLQHERHFIDVLNTINEGYNSTPGGAGGAGLVRSQEDKDNKSAARKAYYETDDGKAWLLKLAEQTRMKNAKVWIITDPDGITSETLNIRGYARDRGLNPSSFFTCMDQRGFWKGYLGKRKAPE